MPTIKQKSLFIEVTAEQSAVVCGGVNPVFLANNDGTVTIINANGDNQSVTFKPSDSSVTNSPANSSDSPYSSIALVANV